MTHQFFAEDRQPEREFELPSLGTLLLLIASFLAWGPTLLATQISTPNWLLTSLKLLVELLGLYGALLVGGLHFWLRRRLIRLESPSAIGETLLFISLAVAATQVIYFLILTPYLGVLLELASRALHLPSFVAPTALAILATIFAGSLSIYFWREGPRFFRVLIVAIPLIALPLTLVAPAMLEQREKARVQQATENLREMGQAFLRKREDRLPTD